MLQIIDINTNQDNLKEVESLKAGFKIQLSPTVKDGTVIIITNFPPIGNMTGKVDYLIMLNVKKTPGNYLRLSHNGKNHYIDSFIYLVKKLKETEITNADNQFVYSKNGAFEYSESIKFYNWEIEDYLKKYDSNIKCFSVYSFQTENSYNFSNDKVLINKQIDANYILSSCVNQYISKYGDYRINSFSKEKFEFYYADALIDLAKEIVSDSETTNKYGILTKKKIDRISTSTKMVDEIYNNFGKSLSVINGKAGTGKTLTLTRVIHKHASNHHNIRFLTFNNLLVFDIKQNLKNFGYYGDNRIAIGTVHYFFFKLSQKLGISLILSEDRVKELINICEKRINKIQPIFERCKNTPDILLNQHEFLKEITKQEKNNTDFDEFREFSKFLISFRNLNDFDEIKKAYLNKKRNLIAPSVGQKKFIEDYYRILELIFLAISDSRKFYDDLNIKNRYDLLSILYNTDKFTKDNSIPYENFVHQVNTLKDTSNWSRLLIVDECQDFHVFEKEILYKLRGSENLVVASGGKEQLIRHSMLLDWSVSLRKKIPFKPFTLYGGSYRQKQNIITFVNKFSDLYGFGLNLKSVSESKGLGKIIIDTRPKESLIHQEILIEMKGNGEINGCSPYESFIILIPSKNYTSKSVSDGFYVNEKDYVSKTETTSNRHTINTDTLTQLNVFAWDGVSENKGKLKVPHQNESRIIHYESCRGLESWSCACMSLDEYFNFKRETTEGENHLADDLFLSEDERRSKYAALWCLMAFTRPIDTLYIHLEKPDCEFSRKIIQLANDCEGTIIYDNKSKPISV